MIFTLLVYRRIWQKSSSKQLRSPFLSTLAFKDGHPAGDTWLDFLRTVRYLCIKSAIFSIVCSWFFNGFAGTLDTKVCLETPILRAWLPKAARFLHIAQSGWHKRLDT